jgi:hypothetical protein
VKAIGHLQSSAGFRKEASWTPYKGASCYDSRPVDMQEGIGSLNILESAKKDRGGVRWAGYVAPMGATRSGERIFVGNSEGGGGGEGLLGNLHVGGVVLR